MDVDIADVCVVEVSRKMDGKMTQESTLDLFWRSQHHVCNSFAGVP